MSTGGLSFHAVEAIQRAVLAAAAAPPSSRYLVPVATEAARRGQMAAQAARQPVDVRIYEAGNRTRIRFTGPGGTVAMRRALTHIEGQLPHMISRMVEETVRMMRPR